jgi:hypothetical protein
VSRTVHPELMTPSRLKLAGYDVAACRHDVQARARLSGCGLDMIDNVGPYSAGKWRSRAGTDQDLRQVETAHVKRFPIVARTATRPVVDGPTLRETGSATEAVTGGGKSFWSSFRAFRRNQRCLRPRGNHVREETTGRSADGRTRTRPWRFSVRPLPACKIFVLRFVASRTTRCGGAAGGGSSSRRPKAKGFIG